MKRRRQQNADDSPVSTTRKQTRVEPKEKSEGKTFALNLKHPGDYRLLACPPESMASTTRDKRVADVPTESQNVPRREDRMSPAPQTSRASEDQTRDIRPNNDEMDCAPPVSSAMETESAPILDSHEISGHIVLADHAYKLFSSQVRYIVQFLNDSVYYASISRIPFFRLLH